MMITCKEDLYGTYVLNDNSGAIELYVDFINSFGIGNKIMEVEQSALALEVCRQGGRWVALWIVHSLSALNPKSVKLTLSDLKPRTKVEYVRADVDSRGQALDAFDNEIELFKLVDGEYSRVTAQLDAISNWRNLYERIETPMTEREAFIATLNELHDEYGALLHEDVSGSLFDYIADSGKFKLVN